MKKLILLILGLVLFAPKNFGQSEDTMLKNEWSANINFFINDIILSLRPTESLNQYEAPIESLVTFRRFYNNNSAWQIGGTFYRKISNEDFIPGIGGEQSEKKLGYFLRTGLIKYHHLSKNVQLYIGSDIQLSFQKYTAEIDFQDVILPIDVGNKYTQVNREASFGIIPHVGFRWVLNSKVSFSTETSLQATYTFFDLDFDNPFSTAPITIVGAETSQEDAGKLRFGIHAPIALLINFRF